MFRTFRSAMVAAILGIGLTVHTPAKALDFYLGQVLLMGTNFCQRDTLPADGRLLPISQHTPLFALYGTTYGGDGRTTFGLPNLKGKEPAKGMRYCVVVAGIFPSRP